MDTMNYFCMLQTRSSLVDTIKNKISSATDSDWYDFLDMSILPLSIADFQNEPNLLKIIERFNCHEKLGIYRYLPNFCYHWHIDSIRNAAINMQIEGEDSFCAFGETVQPRKFKDIKRLNYSNDAYYLINTSKFHTVFNFDNPRFLLSIGISKPTTYDEVKQYIMDNQL